MNIENISSIEIDLSSYSKEDLLVLIFLSDRWQLPINEVFTRVITEYVQTPKIKSIIE